MKMKRIKICDVSEQIRGVSYKPTDIHAELNKNSVILLRANNISDGKINFDEVVYVDKSKVSKKQYLKKGDILICASSGSKQLVGKAASVNFDVECTFGAFCKVVRPCEGFSDYLGVYFQSDIYRRRISELSLGANINNIKNEHIDLLEIPFCDETETDKFVHSISKVQEIIDKRKQQLQQLDELVKARFVEIFGDPVLNPYNWDVVTIGDVVTDVRYGTSKPAVEGGKYPYLRMNNLTYDGHLDLSGMKYIDIPDNEIEKCIVRKGDVLFNRTNSIELVGKTCVFDLDDEMVIAGYIIRVRLNEKLLPIVLSSYMNSTVLKKQLRNMAKGAVNQANINAQELQSIKIYLPPIELQNQFTAFVEQTDKSKVAVQKALDEAQTLFDSLMQEYFG